VLSIKGMGPVTVKKLQLKELTEVYYIDWEEARKVLGEKVALKLQDEVLKSRNASLETVLAAMSIPLFGETAAAKLSKVISNIHEITPEKCKEAGLGDKVTENLMNWMNTEGKEIIPFLPFTYQVSNKSSASENSKTVCITGKLKSYKKKADAEEILRAAGFRLVDSVTKTTDYLVDEGNLASSKRQTAEKYGITIITDLNDLIERKALND
jgi:NAD-dependent DNA ligase